MSLKEKNLVEINDLEFGYGERLILDKINLSFAKGKLTVIMGLSGSGKSTILKFIGGRLIADKGEVCFDQRNLATLDRNQLFKLRRRMGMMFQTNALLQDIDAYENIAFVIREHTNLPEKLIHHLVLLKLQMVGLRGARDLMPAELSGGMARRVALARAIALDPDLIMYDEPFTGLDPIAQGIVIKLIKQLNQALDLTSIVVTHDVNAALEIADYIYILAAGKVVGEGTPDELRACENEQIRQFMSGSAQGPVAFHYPGKNLSDDLLENQA